MDEIVQKSLEKHLEEVIEEYLVKLIEEELSIDFPEQFLIKMLMNCRRNPYKNDGKKN